MVLNTSFCLIVAVLSWIATISIISNGSYDIRGGILGMRARNASPDIRGGVQGMHPMI